MSPPRYFVIVAAHGPTELQDHVDRTHGRPQRAVLFAEPACQGMVYGAVEYEPRPPGDPEPSA